MSTLLLPELARENAASNRRIAHSVEVAARRLEQGPQSHDDWRPLPRQAMRSAQEALRHTLGQATEARNQWQSVLGAFADGLEGDEGREMLQVILDLFDAWFSLVPPTRDLCARAVQLGAVLEGFDQLDMAAIDVATLRTAAEMLRASVSAARPAIDPTVLERARQAIAQGRFAGPEAVRARLRDLEILVVLPANLPHAQRT
jgi:hypothetical protein